MKAAPFDYILAESIDHVLELLARHGGDCKPIAGGQSLVPMMAMRLARPALLIDINRLTDLKLVSVDDDKVRMGATTRQRDVEDDHALHAALPLVRDALMWVGHAQTRNRGTVGGSLVHADPSAELPLAAAVLGATFHLCSTSGGSRAIKAQEFFQGPMFTAVSESECLMSIDWPVWRGANVRTAFEETAMRHGDFAMASAACQIQLEADGTCCRAAIGLGGMDGTPLAFPDIAAQLLGHRIDATLARDVAQACALRTEPGSDLFADAPYRKHLSTVLMTRVLLRAAAVTPDLH